MSLPKAFIDGLHLVPGLTDRTGLIQSLDEESPTSIRINHRKYAGGHVSMEKVRWSKHGYYLSKRPSFTADPLFHAGVYYVQEASSMVIGQVVAQLIQSHYSKQSIRVLDLCGAPGGKSTDVVSQLRADDLMVSNEVVHSRAQVLKENVVKWGYSQHVVTQNDPKDFVKLSGWFDIVIVDAPCSGEGMFRKDQEARSEWSPEHVNLCSARQQRIVADIWDSVAAGGFLIYSTCTFNTAENEKILDFLIDEMSAELYALEENIVAEKKVQRFFPHINKGEGFAYFVVRKNVVDSPTKTKRSKHAAVKFDSVKINRSGSFILKGDEVYFHSHPDEIALLEQSLDVIRPGLHVVTQKKNKSIPSAELAFNLDVKLEYPTISLDTEQSHAYLRCETFDVPVSDRGFNTVNFCGYPLGFINHLGNRFNNNYPTYWRIRTQHPLIYNSFLEI